MSDVTKVTYKIKNLSDAPISFVGIHTLTIPGASEDEYSMSEAAWKKLLPRIRSKKTLVVTKVSDSTESASTSTATTKTTTSTTSTKTTSTKSSKTSSTTSSTSSASTSTSSTTSDSTTSSTDATTSTTEG